MALRHFDGGDVMGAVDAAIERSQSMNTTVGRLLTSLESQLDLFHIEVVELWNEHRMLPNQYVENGLDIGKRIGAPAKGESPSQEIRSMAEERQKFDRRIYPVIDAMWGIERATADIGAVLRSGGDDESASAIAGCSLDRVNAARLLAAAKEMRTIDRLSRLSLEIDPTFGGIASLLERLQAVSEVEAELRPAQPIAPRKHADDAIFYIR